MNSGRFQVYLIEIASLHQHPREVMANEIGVSSDLLPVLAESDCLSSNVRNALHEALDQHPGDPAEIIHDVQRVSGSHLVAALDPGDLSPPDLHLLASFADDADESLYDAAHDFPSSLYDNLFQSGPGSVKPLEEPEAPQYPPPSYPSATSGHGMSILERQLTATTAGSSHGMSILERQLSAPAAAIAEPVRTPLGGTPSRARSAPWDADPYPATNYPYPVFGTSPTATASGSDGTAPEAPRRCTYGPSGQPTGDTYLVPLLPKPRYQEVLVPRSLVFTPATQGYALPAYPRMTDMPGSGAGSAIYTCLREALQSPEGGPGYDCPPWMQWQKPQRSLYGDYAGPQDPMPDAFRRAPAQGPNIQTTSYLPAPPEAAWADVPKDYMNRSPPRYMPPKAADTGYGPNQEVAPRAQAPGPVEYLLPLSFKEGTQGQLCSICFPNNVLPPRPAANAAQPPGFRKQRQYITVRQMLQERAQKRYLNYEPEVGKQDSAPNGPALPYVKPPGSMSTNTVTMSYPPLQPAATTTTSYSTLRQTALPVTSATFPPPPPFYPGATIAPKPKPPIIYLSSQQVAPRAPEVISVLRAQLLAPLVVPRGLSEAAGPKPLMAQVQVAPRSGTGPRLPVVALPKPQLKVSSSYIAVPSSYRLQLPQLFSPTSKSNENGGHGDGTRPPKHYDLEMLRIGTFKVEKVNGPRNKFKIFFSRRKFAYEFSVENVVLAPNHDAAIPHMAIIDVPFNIVTAIHCNDQQVVIAVCSPPKLFLGCKQNRCGGSMCAGIFFDRERPTDITNGQLRTSQVHKISLKRRQAESLRYQLESFDPRFSIILNSPIFEAIAEIEEPTTPNCSSPTDAASGGDKRQGDPYQDLPAKKHCILEIITPDVTPKVSPSPVVCHCQVSCCSNRCSCMKSKTKCGHTPSGCLCKDCNNPLNFLEDMGLDLEESISDPCLVQGVVSYKGDLHTLMKKQLTFPCCGMTTRVGDCIPGKIKCPNMACKGRAYKFSWCVLDIKDELVNPRNHCSVCKSCKDPIDLHCQACRKCNPVEGNCTKCPFCGAARGTSFTEQTSVSEVLGRYRQNQQRGFNLANVINKTMEKVIAIPADKDDLLNLPKIVERLNEKMKEQCVDFTITDEEDNAEEKMEDEFSKENNLVIAEEVNIADSTMQLSDVEVVTTCNEEHSDKGSLENVLV